MKTTDKQAKTPSETGPTAAKKPYVAPQLVLHGAVSELTGGGASGAEDFPSLGGLGGG